MWWSIEKAHSVLPKVQLFLNFSTPHKNYSYDWRPFSNVVTQKRTFFFIEILEEFLKKFWFKKDQQINIILSLWFVITNIIKNIFTYYGRIPACSFWGNKKIFPFFFCGDDIPYIKKSSNDKTSTFNKIDFRIFVTFSFLCDMTHGILCLKPRSWSIYHITSIYPLQVHTFHAIKNDGFSFQTRARAFFTRSRGRKL